jgi:predicted flap endonuclease-1-like 5' DNA nuclease
MLRKFEPFAGETRTISWWWLGIKVGIVTALIIWWWLDQKNKKQMQQTFGVDALMKDDSIPLPPEEPEYSQGSSVLKQTLTTPDDLRKIEGIGPKFQATLQAAGIETFAQLASTDPVDLKQIIVDAGIRLGDPTTWPEQAALAATENWDGLKEFQRTLKGGRK